MISAIGATQALHPGMNATAVPLFMNGRSGDYVADMGAYPIGGTERPAFYQLAVHIDGPGIRGSWNIVASGAGSVYQAYRQLSANARVWITLYPQARTANMVLEINDANGRTARQIRMY